MLRRCMDSVRPHAACMTDSAKYTNIRPCSLSVGGEPTLDTIRFVPTPNAPAAAAERSFTWSRTEQMMLVSSSMPAPTRPSRR